MEKQLIPKLRFPEFKRDWCLKKLGEVSKDVMYGMNSSAITYDGQNKYLRITDIDEKSRTFMPSPLTSPDGEIEEKFKLKLGDIVFARTGASVGKSYLFNPNDGNLLFAGFLIKFSITDANPYFVFSQTLKHSYDKWVKKVSMRSGQPGINAEEYKDFDFYAPQIEEQEKIASCLTSIDERITLLTQQKEKLELYKKGIMQQLFLQELRFKDDNGNDFPEWEEMLFDDITERISTGLNPRKNFSLGSGNNFYVTIKNISNGKLDFSKCEMIDDDALKLINRRSDLSKDDIIMSSIGNIGEAYLLKENPVNWNINESVFMIRRKKNIVTSLYLYYLLTNDMTKKYFISNMTGSSFKSIKIGDLKLMTVLIPSKAEQKKIADFLIAIDNQIEQVNSQKDLTIDFKKGLLQQLFV